MLRTTRRPDDGPNVAIGWMVAVLPAVLCLAVVVAVTVVGMVHQQSELLVVATLTGLGPVLQLWLWDAVRPVSAARTPMHQALVAVVGWLTAPLALTPVVGIIPALLGPEVARLGMRRPGAADATWPCGACGHDLQGLPRETRCPECGAYRTRDWDPLAVPHVTWMASTAMLSAAVMVAAFDISGATTGVLDGPLVALVRLVVTGVAAAGALTVFLCRVRFVRLPLRQQRTIAVIGACLTLATAGLA